MFTWRVLKGHSATLIGHSKPEVPKKPFLGSYRPTYSVQVIAWTILYPNKMSGGTDGQRQERALPTVSQPALDLLRSDVSSIATRALSPLSDDAREMLHRESW